jgi:hypothetical protein
MKATTRTGNENENETGVEGASPADGTDSTNKDMEAGETRDGAGPAADAGREPGAEPRAEREADAGREAGADADDEAAAEAAAEAELAELTARSGSAGTGAGVAGVVSAGLGLVALTGGWPGQVLADREKLDGQLNLPQGSTVAAQIDGLYGNAWHMTALVNGGFALLALLVGAGALLALRPSASSAAAGVEPRPVWMRVIAWSGVTLGVLGLLISAGMYFDLFASMPTAPAGQG